MRTKFYRSVVFPAMFLTLAAVILTTSLTEPTHSRSSSSNPLPETTPEAIICNPEFPPHMVVGQIGKVTDGAPNTLRADPGLGAEQRAMIPGGAKFEVLNGPVCADGYMWWQVRYNGELGWTAEAGDGQYWLISSGIEIPINQINATRLAPYAVLSTGQQMTSVAAGSRMMIGGLMRDGAYTWQLADTFALPGQSSLTPRNLLPGEYARMFATGYFDLISVQLLEDRVMLGGQFLLTGAVESVYLSPSGSTLAAIKPDGTVDLWSLLPDHSVQKYSPWKYMTLVLPEAGKNSEPTRIDDLVFSKSERNLLIAHNTRLEIYVEAGSYNFESRQSINTALHEARLAFDPHNKRAAVTGSIAIDSRQQYPEQYQLQVWDTAYGALMYAVIGLDGMVMSPPSYNPNGDLIALIEGNDSTDEIYLRLIDAFSGRIRASYPLSSGDHVQFDPTGKLLIISTENDESGTLQIWTVQQ